MNIGKRYHFHYFYYAIGVITTITIALCEGFYYGMHSDGPGTISDISIHLPEARVFSVGMNMVAWILLIVFYFNYEIVMILWSVNGIPIDCTTMVAVIMHNVLCIGSFVGLTLLACITKEENRTVHYVGIYLFIVSFSLYILLYDCLCIVGGITVLKRSWTCTAAYFVFLIMALMFRIFSVSKIAYIVFELCFVVCAFSKVSIQWKQLPPTRLELVKK